jgi:carbamate kinase
MRIVVAVGGNALLERGESPDAEIQQRHTRVAVDALAPLARSDQLVITHGNGPQVGLLAIESATDPGWPTAATGPGQAVPGHPARPAPLAARTA